MTDKIEDWARDRVAVLCNAEDERPSDAFARYIMQHETAPVDPLLIEAREVGAGVLYAFGLAITAAHARYGRGDHYDAVQGALAALKSREKRNG